MPVSQQLRWILPDVLLHGHVCHHHGTVCEAPAKPSARQPAPPGPEAGENAGAAGTRHSPARLQRLI